MHVSILIFICSRRTNSRKRRDDFEEFQFYYTNLTIKQNFKYKKYLIWLSIYQTLQIYLVYEKDDIKYKYDRK